jgi:hypothetical protein
MKGVHVCTGVPLTRRFKIDTPDLIKPQVIGEILA